MSQIKRIERVQNHQLLAKYENCRRYMFGGDIEEGIMYIPSYMMLWMVLFRIVSCGQEAVLHNVACISRLDVCT